MSLCPKSPRHGNIILMFQAVLAFIKSRIVSFCLLLCFLFPNKILFFALFDQAYEMRNAGAVIHSHGMESCLVTMINPLAKEFRVNS